MRKPVFILSFLCCSFLFIWVTFALPESDYYLTKDNQSAENIFKKIPFDWEKIKSGDLIVCQGKSFFSNELRKRNLREQKYSHCGIAIRDSSQIMVYNSTGGTENPDSYVKKELLTAFLHPDNVNSFAIYRYRLEPKQSMGIIREAEKYFQGKVPFDLQFNLENDDRLYCSELVYKSVVAVTGQGEFIPLSRSNGKVYIGIDDLYINENTTKIFEYVYH